MPHNLMERNLNSIPDSALMDSILNIITLSKYILHYIFLIHNMEVIILSLQLLTEFE